MAQRSRKHGRREQAPREPVAPATEADRKDADARGAPPEPAAPSRTEQRNAAVRATLTPLAPGERPWAIRISATIGLVLAAVNLVFLVAGYKPKLAGQHTAVSSEILYLVLMSACAWGLWRMRHWAVLGFMVILLITILEVSLALIRASNLLGVLIPVVVIVGGGLLFFKLVRSLSRIEMPKAPGR